MDLLGITSAPMGAIRRLVNPPTKDHGAIDTGTVTVNARDAAWHKIEADGDFAVEFLFRTGRGGAVVVECLNFGAHTITWPNGLKWAAAELPTFQTTGCDLIVVAHGADDVLYASPYMLDAVAELRITTASLPESTVSEVYTATLALVGGKGPYTWEVDAGSTDPLPAGLSLNAETGAITGDPDAGADTGDADMDGDYEITFLVTDADAREATRELTLTVLPAE